MISLRSRRLVGAYRPIGKLFINTLYGCFGYRHRHEVTVMISSNMVDYYAQRYDIIDMIPIEDFTLPILIQASLCCNT